MYGDSDWARTSDPHPVKMVLSRLSYRVTLSISKGYGMASFSAVPKYILAQLTGHVKLKMRFISMVIILQLSLFTWDEMEELESGKTITVYKCINFIKKVDFPFILVYRL